MFIFLIISLLASNQFGNYKQLLFMVVGMLGNPFSSIGLPPLITMDKILSRNVDVWTNVFAGATRSELMLAGFCG